MAIPASFRAKYSLTGETYAKSDVDQALSDLFALVKRLADDNELRKSKIEQLNKDYSQAAAKADELARGSSALEEALAESRDRIGELETENAVLAEKCELLLASQRAAGPDADEFRDFAERVDGKLDQLAAAREEAGTKLDELAERLDSMLGLLRTTKAKREKAAEDVVLVSSETVETDSGSPFSAPVTPDELGYDTDPQPVEAPAPDDTAETGEEEPGFGEDASDAPETEEKTENASEQQARADESDLFAALRAFYGVLQAEEDSAKEDQSASQPEDVPEEPAADESAEAGDSGAQTGDDEDILKRLKQSFGALFDSEEGESDKPAADPADAAEPESDEDEEPEPEEGEDTEPEEDEEPEPEEDEEPEPEEDEELEPEEDEEPEPEEDEEPESGEDEEPEPEEDEEPEPEEDETPEPAEDEHPEPDEGEDADAPAQEASEPGSMADIRARLRGIKNRMKKKN